MNLFSSFYLFILSYNVALITMDTMSLLTSPHVASHLQTPPVQQFINLNEFEMSIANSIQHDATKAWSCIHCDTNFEDVMTVAIHLLMHRNRNHATATFSTRSAIKICMLLDEASSIHTLQCYLRVVGGNLDEDVPPPSECEYCTYKP